MISIIILNYNGRKFLADCLQSVLFQSYTDFEIIFVDNNSSDGSLDFVLDKDNFNDTRIKCFSTERNLGFAGGNNYGLKYAEGEYIVLLNNDTVVDKDWLKFLYEAINKDEKTGIVQSLVYTEGIPEKYYFKNGTLNLLGHNIMEIFDIGKDGTGEIFQVNGCSLIIRKELVKSFGGLFLDEYFAYAEDSYLSFKVKFAGLKAMHTSKSIVKHFGSATTKEYKSLFRTFLQERNRLLNFLIFFSKGFRLKYYPILLFNLKLKLFMSLFPGKYSFSGVLKAYIWLYKNRNWIKEQREKENRFKKIDENEVIKYLSGKLFNGKNLLEKFLNFFSLLYCRILNIKVIEIK
jgi:GT2 family glycosyltransferase